MKKIESFESSVVPEDVNEIINKTVGMFRNSQLGEGQKRKCILTLDNPDVQK